MSMEVHVPFSGELPSGAALDEALERLRLPIRLADAPATLDGWTGFLPVILDGRSTGVELDVFDGAAAVRETIGSDPPAGVDRVANLRWGGEIEGAVVAFGIAAALASILGGSVFEPSERVNLSVDEAVDMSREAMGSGPT
jgi:hypothetical protein